MLPFEHLLDSDLVFIMVLVLFVMNRDVPRPEGRRIILRTSVKPSEVNTFGPWHHALNLVMHYPGCGTRRRENRDD